MATTRNQQSEDRRRNRKGVIAIGAIGASAALIIGGGFAYFSDSLSFGGSATAGTLDISASNLVVDHTDGLTVDNYVTDGVTNGNVENFDPGDVLRLTGDITNNGNKSAWIRTAITGVTADSDIAKDLYVYTGESVPSQSDLLGASDLTTLPGYVGTAQSLASVSATSPAASTVSPVIIGGTGTAAEDDSTTAAGGNEYGPTVVVYFAKTATNEDQAEAVSITATVQALQYRNDTTAPDSTGWASVVTTAFGSDAAE